MAYPLGYLMCKEFKILYAYHISAQKYEEKMRSFARCGSFDSHIAMVYDILCNMAYVMKCHKMSFLDIL